MKYAICDDNPRDAEALRDILTHRDGNDVIDLFETGAAFLAAAAEQHYDLVFMDIYLGEGEDGVEVVRKLRTVSPQTFAAFTTVSDSHALAAFSVRAIHYLVKPFNEADVAETLERMNTAKGSDHQESTLTVCIGRDIYTLNQRDILRVEASDHKTNIFLKNGSVYSIRMLFSKVEEQLDGHFLTINRGIAVNMRYITRWFSQDCEMTDGRRYLLNQRKRQQLRETYFNYRMDEMTAQGS